MSFPSQEFVENSKKMGWYKPDDGDGREMKPMVSWRIFVVFSPIRCMYAVSVQLESKRRTFWVHVCYLM